MTDETPDPTPETPATPDEGPAFVVVPTLLGFGELVDRVEHLEASALAQPADDEDDDDVDVDEQLQARLGRHRTEIEQIKGRLNAVIRYLTVPGVELPNPIPPAPVADPATPASTSGETL